MLRRDFNKSNKEYFLKNKNILISIAAFLIIGILLFAIIGMNGNFEIKGYNEFQVTVNEDIADNYSKYKNRIISIVNSYNGKFDNVLVSGEGDDTKFVVRYLNDIDSTKELEINKLIAEEININVDSVSEHVHVEGALQNKDIVYTVVSILLIILIASIFAYARYNGASAMAIIISNLLGTIGFISIGSILRLSIGMSYQTLLIFR